MFFVLCAEMSFAKSLRVIGQSLEIAKVLEFKLEGDGRNFMLQSDSMSRKAEAMQTLRGLMLGKRNGAESFLPHGPSFQPRSCLNSYGFWATISTETPREHFIFSGCPIR